MEKLKMFKKLFIFFSIITTFAVAGILFKNGEVEKRLKKAISQVDNFHYSELYCTGITSTTCSISDINYSKNGLSISVKKFTVEKIEELENIYSDKNGTFPFVISLENINILESDYSNQISYLSAELKDADKKFDLEVLGEINRLGSQETLKLEHLLISNNLLNLNLSLDLRVENRKSFLFKEILTRFENRELLQRAYEIESKDRNLTISEFRKQLISKAISTTNSQFKKSFVDSLNSVVKDNGKDSMEIEISTKSKEYIDVYQLFIIYNMLYMFQGFDGLEKELNKTFNIKIEAK